MIRPFLGKFLPVSLAFALATGSACATDWLMYGFDLQRTGENPNETILTPATVAGLHKLWSFNLGAVTIMQPVLAEHVMVNSSPQDLVFIGSEHGDFYALNAESGALVWQRNLGSQQTACGDIPGNIFGVSGSPSIDRAGNLLYVVGGDGKMYALDLSTGATLPQWPVTITSDPAHEHTYGGVNVTGRYAYAELASYCDITPYHGRVVAVDLRRHRTRVFLPAGNNVNGGGIWGPGGVSVDPATGHVFAATGNALTDPEYFHYSDSVVELTSTLGLVGFNYPGLTGADVDFGATPILYDPPGCPPMVAAKNKTGVLVTYQRGNLSAGPVQRLQVASSDDWQFNGIPAWSNKTRLLYIGNSSDSDEFQHGMIALSAGADCQLHLAWQNTIGPNFTSVSPPTVAGGVVYYGDGYDRELLAFDGVTGSQLWSSGTIIKGPIYAAPMVVNGRVYVGAWDGKFYAFGL